MVPREKMGTINSGFLFISKILGIIIGPVVGYAIKGYSYYRFGWGTQKWDYSGGFLVYFALGVIGSIFYLCVVEPQWRKGTLTAAQGTAPGPVSAESPATVQPTSTPS
jgi:hypothetical protein